MTALLFACSVVAGVLTALKDLDSVKGGSLTVLFAALGAVTGFVQTQLQATGRSSNAAASQDESSARTEAARRDLLEEVRRTWVRGVLERSLAEVARIELGLVERSSAVPMPLHSVVKRPPDAERRLDDGTQIAHVFHDLGRRLLILGEPGAGKTTLLLELTRSLIADAQADRDHPTPVVLHLASWAHDQGSLADWMVEELHRTYGVARRLGRVWVNTERIIPLLDGLDEVATNLRDACVSAINEFRVEHGQLPMAVCSRTEEYEQLSTRLELRGAVVIQALDRLQVDRYVREVGRPLAGLRRTMREDESLYELLTTPLWLSFVVLTYQSRSGMALPMDGTLAQRRQQIIADYVRSRFQRGRDADQPPRYSAAQTIHWLASLARTMQEHSQSVFYVDAMPLDHLSSHAQRRLVSVGVAVGVALITAFVAAPDVYFGWGLSESETIGIGLGTTVLSAAALTLCLFDVLGRSASLRLLQFCVGVTTLALAPWMIPDFGPSTYQGVTLALDAVAMLVPLLILTTGSNRSSRWSLALMGAVVGTLTATTIPSVQAVPENELYALALSAALLAGCATWLMARRAGSASTRVGLFAAAVTVFGPVRYVLRFEDTVIPVLIVVLLSAAASLLITRRQLTGAARLCWTVGTGTAGGAAIMTWYSLVLHRSNVAQLTRYDLSVPQAAASAVLIWVIVSCVPSVVAPLGRSARIQVLAFLLAAACASMTAWWAQSLLSITLAIILIIAISVGIFAYGRDTAPSEQLHWSWLMLGRRLRRNVLTAVLLAMSLTLTMAIVSPLWYLAYFGEVYTFGLIVTVVAFGIAPGLIAGMVLCLAGGLETRLVVAPVVAGRGMETSRRNAFTSALITGMGALVVCSATCILFGFGSIVFPAARFEVGGSGSQWLASLTRAVADTLSDSNNIHNLLISGLAGVLTIGLLRGGASYLRLHAVRVLLVLNGTAPRDYVDFLDYASRLVLTRRRGGGYEFIHRLLLEHFASTPDATAISPPSGRPA